MRCEGKQQPCRTTKTYAGSKTGRINVNEDYELQYWSEKFGVSRDELRQAVQKVGVSPEAVERELKGRR